MEQDAILITDLKIEKDKNGRDYLSVIDGFGNRYNLFGELAKTKLEVGKGYLFKYEWNGEYKQTKAIENLNNVFKIQALKELASRADLVKNMGISLSYAVDLAKEKVIETGTIFEWAIKFNKFIQDFADSEMAKSKDDLK